jgi:hypothetical protein
VIQKKKKKAEKVFQKKKKKERKKGLRVDHWCSKAEGIFWKRNSAYWRKSGKKKLIEMSEDDKVPIILENIYHFYHYFFVSYFPSLNPTLRPDKSPYLILRNVWFRNFHD